MIRAGDVNDDLVVDQSDLVKMLQGDKYNSGDAAAWTDGDFNRDHVFDQLDIVTMLQADLYLQGPYFDFTPVSELDSALHSSSSFNATRPVPEPASLAVLLIGLLITIPLRRRNVFRLKWTD